MFVNYRVPHALLVNMAVLLDSFSVRRTFSISDAVFLSWCLFQNVVLVRQSKTFKRAFPIWKSSVQ